MTTDPKGPSIERAHAFSETVRGLFGAERRTDGTRPSREDFEQFCWPTLARALSATWSSAAAVDDRYREVRELVIGSVHPAFPPTRIVFVSEPGHGQDPRRLIVIGIDFDWDYEWPDNE